MNEILCPSYDACRHVFAPKLGAVSFIAAAAQRQPLASLALFSSVASLLGAAGQVRCDANSPPCPNALLCCFKW